MGKLKCKALPFFHAVTGADESSSLHGVGKKKFWKVFAKMGTVAGVRLSYPSLTLTFYKDLSTLATEDPLPTLKQIMLDKLCSQKGSP